MVRETPPYEERFNASAMPTKKWPTSPKIWRNSKNFTGILDGTSITPSACWLMPMPIEDSNHASSTMPPSLPTFPLLPSMQESLISPIGGNTAPTTNTQIVNGVHKQDTRLSGVHKSISVSFAMEQDISRPTAATPISTAEKNKSAEFQITTPAVLIPPVPQTLEPSDGKKDIEREVMS